MREFLDNIDVVKVDKKVSPKYEIPAVSKKLNKPVLFKNVEGYDIPVLMNLASSRDLIAHSLGCKIEDISERLLDAMSKPAEVKVEGELDAVEPDLSKLPVLNHYAKDRGKYITSGVVITKDSQNRRNASIHRMLVKDNRRLGIRIVKRHLFENYKEAEKRGKPLDVAISIGLDPKTLIGVSTRVPKGFDEFRLVGALMEKNLNLIKCDTVDIEVPKSEIVLEGKILCGDREPEGPFVDITGTYDSIRNQPIIELTGMNIRRDAIYQGILPAGKEHRLIMGLPYEPLILKEVNKVCDAMDVALTEGGSCYLHGVVKINKRKERDGIKAIKAAKKAHGSMKHCIVVDEDIDIYDYADIDYAISTRVKGDEDIHVFPESKGSTLDPRGKDDGTVTKVGVDATKKLKNTERFLKEGIPGEEDLNLDFYI